MEFFFLTQNVYIEILVFIFLIVVLLAIWGTRFYAWIKMIYMAFHSTKRVQPKITETSEKGEVVPQEEDIDTVEEANKQNTIDTEEVPENIEKQEADIPVSEKVDTSQVEKLANLVSSARTLIARGMIVEAKTLIVEGLSYEKDHRDLNFLLGTIYEQEGQYEKAEYIYKDMAELHPNDLEILEKLANVLIIEKKYHIASEIYKKIHSSTGNTETTLYMLTHISNTLEDHHSTLTYAKQYVLQWPKNPEIISLLATVQVTLGHRKDAIESYKHLKNLTPYSSEISEILQKLLIEEELANNFAGKEV